MAEQFDALCAQVDEYEQLPEVTLTSRESDPPVHGAPTDEDSLNEEILAGLVSQ